MIHQSHPHTPEPAPPTRSDRLLVVVLAAIVFLYLLFRLIQTWGQWPEDSSTAALRIVELALIAAFAFWMAAPLLRRQR
jgi:hypothetical protein